MEDISDPFLVCYSICDLVWLMINFSLYKYDEKLIKTVPGLLEFPTIVNDESSLNKGSVGLVKLDTPKNLT